MGRQRRVALAAVFFTVISTGSVWACGQCTTEMILHGFRFLVPWCLLIPVWMLVVTVAWFLDGERREGLGLGEVLRPGIWMLVLMLPVQAFLGLGLVMGGVWLCAIIDRLSKTPHRSPWIFRTNVLFIVAALGIAPFSYWMIPVSEMSGNVRAKNSRTMASMRTAAPDVLSQTPSESVFILDDARYVANETVAYDKSPLRAIRVDLGCLLFSCGPDRIWPEDEQVRAWVAEDPDPAALPLVAEVYNPTNGTVSPGMLVRWVPVEE